MSARAGGGSRLLTATQYETETRAFEEQVHGYQSAMTKLLREMRKNLELPMEEVASMVKASEGEGSAQRLSFGEFLRAKRQQQRLGEIKDSLEQIATNLKGVPPEQVAPEVVALVARLRKEQRALQLAEAPRLAQQAQDG